MTTRIPVAMLFGSPKTFAVEAVVYHQTPKYVFGHLRFWIGGEGVGEFGQNLVLGTPVIFIRDFLAFDGPRNHPSLSGKTDREVLAICYWALYSDGKESAEEQACLPFQQFDKVYQNFELCPRLCPSLDGNRAVLLEEDGYDRIIWLPHRKRKPRSLRLPSGECVAALTGFAGWAEAADIVADIAASRNGGGG